MTVTYKDGTMRNPNTTELNYHWPLAQKATWFFWPILLAGISLALLLWAFAPATPAHANHDHPFILDRKSVV